MISSALKVSCSRNNLTVQVFRLEAGISRSPAASWAASSAAAAGRQIAYSGLGSCAIGICQRRWLRYHALPSYAGLASTDVLGGQFGLVQGAASGDEIDRLDYGLGIPGNAVELATTKLAGGHPDNYIKKKLFPMANVTGTTSEKINWVGEILYMIFDRNVERIYVGGIDK